MKNNKNIEQILEKMSILGLEYNHKNGGFLLKDEILNNKIKKTDSTYTFIDSNSNHIEFISASSFLEAFNKTVKACNIKIFS